MSCHDGERQWYPAATVIGAAASAAERPRLLELVERAGHRLDDPRHPYSSSSGAVFDDATALSSSPLPASSPSPSHPAAAAAATATAGSWQPTRLTSPFCVFGAVGVIDDFYTGGLSWGREHIAAALATNVLLFRSSSLGQAAIAPLDGAGGGGPAPRPSSVAVTRFSDTACFVGLVDGTVRLYSASADGGALVAGAEFALPTAAISQQAARLSAAAATGGGPVARAARLLAQAQQTFSAVGCLSTTAEHPFLVAAGTGAGELVTVDARQRRVAIRFGAEGAAASTSGASPFPSPPSAAAPPPTLPELLSSVRGVDRVCGVNWNANGSLIATGGGSGVVRIWSTAHTRAPLHTIRVDAHSTLKAVCFHPTNPYELLVGGDAGARGLGIFHVGGATPALEWAAATPAQVAQAVYSPDGHHVVAAHGAVVAGAAETAAAAEGPNGVEPLPGLSYNPVEALDAIAAGRRRPVPATAPSSKGPALASFALAVWEKCGGGGGGGGSAEGVRRAVEEELLTRDGGSHSGGCDEWRPRDDAPQPLRMLYAMPGHRSRPLHLATPFYGADTGQHRGGGDVRGCVVSEAGGDDNTLRFWRVFQPAASPAPLSKTGSSGHIGGAPSGGPYPNYDETPLR